MKLFNGVFSTLAFVCAALEAISNNYDKATFFLVLSLIFYTWFMEKDT